MKITTILALILATICVVQSIPEDPDKGLLQKELQGNLIQDSEEHVRPKRQSCAERCNSLCLKKGLKGVCVKDLCRCA